MNHLGLVEAGGSQGEGQRVGDVFCPHSRTQLASDDVAGEVIEYGGQVEPTPADDFQISEIGLPQLIGCGGLVLELIGSLDHDEGRTGDETWALSSRYTEASETK